MTNKNLAVVFFVACIGCANTPAALGDEYYAGKTIRITVPTNSLASGYGLYGHLAATHLERFIPGAPKVVISYMPGAVGMTALNHLYTIAPKDGTLISVFSQDLATDQARNRPGVRYDARRFSYIARATSNVPVHMVWHTANVSNFADLQQREVLSGAVGSGGVHSDLPRAMNALLGAKWKVIGGYPGGNDVRIAMERGEVQAAISPATLFNDQLKPWLTAGTVKVVVQYSDFRHAALPDVPHVVELAQTPEARAILKFMVAISTIGRAFAGPPDMASEALNILRKSFVSMFGDPAFRADAEKRGADIEPMSGDDLAAYISGIIATPPNIVAQTNELLEGK